MLIHTYYANFFPSYIAAPVLLKVVPLRLRSLEEHGSLWPVLREPAFFGSEIKDRGHGSREPAPCKISAYFWFCGRFPQSELK